MIYSNKSIPRKLAYFNNYLETAAMVLFLSDFSGFFVIHPLIHCSEQASEFILFIGKYLISYNSIN